MARRILKCVDCGSYTMKEEHCSKRTVNPKPAKFSPEDKYQEYRMIYKQKFK
jgi:H/ACA ribonucleoprotein complex subunit 3